jgi:gluconolactonase
MTRFALFLAAAALQAQFPERFTIERVAAGMKFAEGPVWSLDDYLLFSDTVTDRQHKFQPGKGVSEAASRAGGTSGMAYDNKGNLYVCEFRARRLVRLDRSGKAAVVAERFEGKRLNAPNDVVVRKDGNVYFTDPAFGNQQDAQELDFHGVYRVTPRGEVQAIARWKTRPNGIALSASGRALYVSNADEGSVYAFDLDRGGEASNPRVAVARIPGAPGGLRLDQDGNLYVAAEQVYIYSPKADLLRTITLPETPSNLAWGDPDFGTLYVTARTSVYRVRVGVRGAVPYFD